MWAGHVVSRSWSGRAKCEFRGQLLNWAPLRAQADRLGGICDHRYEWERLLGLYSQLATTVVAVAISMARAVLADGHAWSRCREALSPGRGAPGPGSRDRAMPDANRCLPDASNQYVHLDDIWEFSHRNFEVFFMNAVPHSARPNGRRQEILHYLPRYSHAQQSPMVAQPAPVCHIEMWHK